MKKGFTMIELIFVIVILGILASVAIPRLAATRADAEISAAIANMRTLLSDAAAFEVTNGSFKKTTTDATGTTTTAVVDYAAITNVALVGSNGAKLPAGTKITDTAYIAAGGKPCIGVSIVEKDTTGGTIKPAYLKLTKATGTAGVCDQVTAAESVKAFTEHQIDTKDGAAIYGIAIGSDTEVYKSTGTTTGGSN